MSGARPPPSRLRAHRHLLLLRARARPPPDGPALVSRDRSGDDGCPSHTRSARVRDRRVGVCLVLTIQHLETLGRPSRVDRSRGAKRERLRAPRGRWKVPVGASTSQRATGASPAATRWRPRWRVMGPAGGASNRVVADRCWELTIGLARVPGTANREVPSGTPMSTDCPHPAPPRGMGGEDDARRPAPARASGHGAVRAPEARMDATQRREVVTCRRHGL